MSDNTNILDQNLYSNDSFIGSALLEPQHTSNGYIEFDISSKDWAQRDNVFAAYEDSSIKTETAESSTTIEAKMPDDFNGVIKLAFKSLSNIPGSSTSPITIARANEQIKFSGIDTFSSISLVFQDYIGLDTVAWVHKWDTVRYNPATGKRGLAKDYKVNGTIYQYAPDGTLQRSYLLKGCWVHNVSYGSIQYGQDAAREVTFSVEIDKAYPLPLYSVSNSES